MTTFKTPEANTLEGLQLQLTLVREMLCDEITFLDIVLNGANTRKYEKIEDCSDAEIIIISKKFIENKKEQAEKLEIIHHYYLLLIDQRRHVKEVTELLQATNS